MDKLIGDLLSTSAQRFGDKTALKSPDREFTFNELNELAGNFGRALLDRGVSVGDRVTLYGVNSWQWLIAYHGALKVGAVINPVNVMLTPKEVEFVLDDCQSTMLIADRHKLAPLMDVRSTLGVNTLICLDTETESIESVETLALLPGDVPPRPNVAAGDLSTICYTSGTTGFPKGAMLSHEAVLLNAAMTAAMHERGSDDVVISALPLPHVYGNVVMNSALMYGSTFVMRARFDAKSFLADIASESATIMDGVPTMYMYMLGLEELDQTDLSSLTRCAVGGQAMPESKMRDVEERFGCPLIDLWGMTEIAGLGSTHPVKGPALHGSIGCAIPYSSLRVADVDDASITLPPGEVGELMAKGPTVMIGYFGNEAATRETIEPDGWLHTGDLATADDHGRFYIVDRKKDMILTAGFNVYPAEIERVIAAHPDVALVAVGRVPDEEKGELANAYVVLKDGRVGDADSILALCKDDLAAYKVPRAVHFVDDLPKTSSGKIMRRALKDLVTVLST